MTFSPQLEARFAKLLKSYPEGRQRAAMIPMLLYAQDEVGHVSDELIEEVAKRVGVTALQVNEVMSYYSMLHRKPLGKYHVQICTNISCLLHDGDKLWEHACKKLGIGHKEATADGQISLEEVECMGACSWAPAIQVNYDFHHFVTPEKLDQFLDGLKDRSRKRAHAVQRTQPARNQGAIAPLRIAELGVHRHVSRHRRLRGVSEGRGDEARADHRGGEGLQPARARRGRLPHGDEVELRAAHFAQAEIHRGERRRERAGHLQRPRADRKRSAPVDRRRADRGAGGGRARRLHLHPRRIPLPDRDHGQGHRRGVRERLAGQEHSGHGVRFRSVHAHRARAPTSAARNRRCWNRSKASAAFRASGRRFRRWWARFSAPPC